MAIFSGISDWLTGGRDEQAEAALNQAMQAYSGIQAPTQQQLSLPELQQYVDAGLMTPAQAQAYLQTSNAYSTENVPQTGTAAQVAALNQLSGVADAGAAGTPVEQAQIAQAIEQMNQSVAGQRGAIEQAAEARGTPGALVQSALANQSVGQDAQQAYLNSLNSQANAYQTALGAMSQGANVGSNLQQQQNTQANTVAQAQNAMQQFNAANQQQASALNANLRQQAGAYNTQNAQNIANQNTGTANARTAYNTSQAQTAFDDAMAKAQGEAGIASKQAQNYTDMGNQSYGTAMKIFGGLSDIGQSMATPSAGSGGIGAGANGIGEGSVPGIGPVTGPQNLAAYAPLAAAKGGIVPNHEYCYHDGGICMDKGAIVPGKPEVPGNSIRNDKVHIAASPGEAVIPVTSTQAHLPEVLSLIAEGRHGGQNFQGSASMHPHDVATVLHALRELRAGVV